MNKVTRCFALATALVAAVALSAAHAASPDLSSKKEVTPLDDSFFDKGFEMSLSGIYEGGQIDPHDIAGTRSTSVGSLGFVVKETIFETRVGPPVIIKTLVAVPKSSSSKGGTSGRKVFVNNAGGVGLDGAYFVTKNIGFDLGAAWTSGDSGVFELSASVIYRIPLQPSNKRMQYAPYFLAGGDGLFGDRSIAAGHVGGGFEVRLSKHIGIFIDGRWVIGGDGVNFGAVHSGLRYAF